MLHLCITSPKKIVNGSLRDRDITGPVDPSSDEKILSFDGVMEANSLCNEPIFDVDIENSVIYNLEVTENTTYGVRSCYGHPVKVEYTLKLDTQTTNPKVVVNQNNLTKSFQTEDFTGFPENQGQPEEDGENEESEDTDEKSQSSGLLSNIAGFFNGFF